MSAHDQRGPFPADLQHKCDPRMDVVFVFRDSREKGGLSR
jgi:hypothetical protein